jgi:hypothetical protein
MLLRGAIPQPRILTESQIEDMRRNTFQDRPPRYFQNRDSPRDRFNSRVNGDSQYSQTNESQHMKWNSNARTPGIPPSNVQASAWYEQTSTAHSSDTAHNENGGHNSGIMRLDDLQAQFGGRNDRRYQDRGYQDRGYHNRSRGSGYYSGQHSGYGGYRDSRR